MLRIRLRRTYFINYHFQLHSSKEQGEGQIVIDRSTKITTHEDINDIGAAIERRVDGVVVIRNFIRLKTRLELFEQSK